MRLFLSAAVLFAAVGGIAACTDQNIDHVSRPTDWRIGAAAPAGPPVDCIEQGRVRSTVVRDERTIDFTMEDGTLLRNRLPFACAGLSNQSRFAYRTALPRLCSTDQITLSTENGRAGANCGLGVFQPVIIPPNPRGQQVDG